MEQIYKLSDKVKDLAFELKDEVRKRRKEGDVEDRQAYVEELEKSSKALSQIYEFNIQNDKDDLISGNPDEYFKEFVKPKELRNSIKKAFKICKNISKCYISYKLYIR